MAGRGKYAFGAKARRTKKPKRKASAFLRKNWRQPTLAESIKPLPSARLRLTAVFGMGTGRTTALWPPKKCQKNKLEAVPGVFAENYTQKREAFPIRELKSLFPCG